MRALGENFISGVQHTGIKYLKMLKNMFLNSLSVVYPVLLESRSTLVHEICASLISCALSLCITLIVRFLGKKSANENRHSTKYSNRMMVISYYIIKHYSKSRIHCKILRRAKIRPFLRNAHYSDQS